MPPSTGPSRRSPAVLGLFHPIIPGPELLMELARQRFQRAGLGTEYNAEDAGELERRQRRYAPAGNRPATVHLRRGLNLFHPQERRLIGEVARRFAPHLLGMVVHDQLEAARRPREVLGLLEEINAELVRIEGGPMLFIEYAVFLPPALFVELFESARSLERVSACIDVGHLGLAHVRHRFAIEHDGDDVCRYTPADPRVPALLAAIEATNRHALPMVSEVTRALAALGKPLHFHLHDGHPLSTISPMGVCDHLSFLESVPIPFEHGGKRTLATVFGPAGLRTIVADALAGLPAEEVSFTLEIHPPPGRSPLAPDAGLDIDPGDLERAERMNHWMDVLETNQKLLLEACAATGRGPHVGPPGAGKGPGG